MPDFHFLLRSKALTLLLGVILVFGSTPNSAAKDTHGPIRVLFLGHEAVNHRSDLYFPMIARALGRDAIYFDYVISPAQAFDDADYLNRFDAVLIYANHKDITPKQWSNLLNFVEKEGKGFVPVHCASWCFQNEPGFDRLVGGRFAKHKGAVFSLKTVEPAHAAIKEVPGFEAWDETYVHKNHNPEGRTVLQVREVGAAGSPDNITEAEPWTWVREQGKGRIFYTASGHDDRVWNQNGFQQLLKAGILWSVGDERRAGYDRFLAERPPLRYEKRDNIPNYEKRGDGPLPYQQPLAPEDSLKYTRAPIDFRLELFASEPDIINPICLTWDERGRLWVAETTDYPNTIRSEGGNDKIKILEDTDGDGKCDKVTVFADGLNIPTSLTHWNGGIIVAMAPDFVFMKDTDGDNIADVREVLFSGWGKQDTHAGPSNLRYGFDNWIYGAVGYSRFTGELGGQAHNFGSGIYRFKPDASAIEFLYQFNNNTWGLGFTGSGEVFGSTANNAPSFFGGMPATAYENPGDGMSAKMIADSRKFHPITPNVRQVDAFGAYTAGAGHAFATSENFPESWRDRSAFVAGPTGGLLGRFQIEADGSGFISKNQYPVVASADEWFSPVAAEVGPDGNLWIADWYNFIIQHNPVPSVERAGYNGVKGEGNAHRNPNRDKQHGRIYRLVRDQAKQTNTASLATADSDQLIASLGDSNLFWRLTAQRLLVEKGDRSVAEKLRRTVASPQSGRAAIHAMWTLSGLNELDRNTHQLALLSRNHELQANAIRALGNDAGAIQLFFDTAVVQAKSPAVRRVAFNKLAHFPESDLVKHAAGELIRNSSNREDEWLALALKTAAGNQGISTAFTLGENLLPNPSFEKAVAPGKPAGWSIRTYHGEAEHGIPNKVQHSGKRSLRIRSENGADSSWHTVVQVEPHTDYRLSAWIKTVNIRGAQGAMLNVHGHQYRTKTTALQRTNDWTEVEVFFNSGDRTKVDINCLYGGWGTSTGTAFFDDVALQELLPAGGTADDAIADGDIKRGKQIFDTHPVAACIRCHVVDGKGGPVGPPLDGIASRKQRDYLEQSLVDPQAVIAEGFQAEVSPMPPMKVLLTPQEFADVMAYLLTLK